MERSVPGVSDVAVAKITVSKNFVNGSVAWISVAVANYGTRYKTFNVTLYYGSTEIDTKTVKDLAPSISSNLNFTWGHNTGAQGKLHYNCQGSSFAR